MAEEWIEIKCARCGQSWYEDPSTLGEPVQVVYRGGTEEREYRRSCPHCGRWNVVTLAAEEGDDG